MGILREAVRQGPDTLIVPPSRSRLWPAEVGDVRFGTAGDAESIAHWQRVIDELIAAGALAYTTRSREHLAVTQRGVILARLQPRRDPDAPSGT